MPFIRGVPRPRCLAVVATLLLLAGDSADALTINGTGADSSGTLPGLPVNALAEASQNTNPSSFSTNIFTGGGGLGNETKDSVAISFVGAGWVDISGTAYLPLTYDLQETASQEAVIIGMLRLCLVGACGEAGSNEVWSSTENILVNTDAGDLTIGPLGNSKDLTVFVPLSIFDGLGVTEGSSFFLEATQSNANNGGDEWTLSDHGINPTYTSTVFTPGQTIDSTIIPEPGTALLLATGVLGLALRRRFERP